MCIANKALNKYLNPIFVETGTYFGEGVAAAQEAGFEKIYSIEVSPLIHAKVSKTFSDDEKVTIVCGDSTKILWSVIESIDEKITFLLDAHSLGWADDTKDNKSLVEFPLTNELETIAKHHRKDHTILVDDVRLFSSLFGTSIEEITKLVLQINPQYELSFEDGVIEYGEIGKDEILVAQV